MRQVVENAIESNTIRVVLVWGLLFTCVLSAVSYAYWLNKAIFEAVETKQLKVTVADLSSSLNALQEQYLMLKDAATLSRAQVLGLTETDAATYISRKSLGRGLSLRDEI